MSLRNRVAVGTKVTAIVLATFAIYYQDLAAVANEAIRSEPMSHILAVPLLLAYLIYRKRRMLRVTIPLEESATERKTINTQEIVGALLCLLSFLLYWQGSYSFNPLEYHMISLPIFIAGLILIIFNSKTLRVLAFPMAFLLFLVPIPLEFLQAGGKTLSIASSEAAYAILRGAGFPVALAWQYENPIITLTKPGSAPIAFTIGVACSGLYSLTSFTIFAVFIAYIARAELWKKCIVFAGGLSLIYGLNIVRIMAIILLGAQSGLEAATQAFHFFGGWVLILVATVILLIISERIFKMQLFTTKNKTISCNCSRNNPGTTERLSCDACGRILNPSKSNLSKSDLTRIAIITIATILIINLQVPLFALTAGPAKVITQTRSSGQITTEILPSIPGYTTRFIYRDRGFEEMAKQDASLAYAYAPSNGSGKTIWTTVEVAKTRSSLHSWEVCLVTWPLATGHEPRVTQIDLRDIRILQNPPITARYLAFQDKASKVTQVVLYWYENSLFQTGRGLELEQVKISFISFADKSEDIPAVEKQLLSFAEPTVNYWQPIKRWSQLALLISQNGNILSAITATSIATVLTYQIIKGRMKKKSNLRIYNRLASEEERLILQAVHQARKTKPSADTIATYYQELSGRRIEIDALVQKLKEAEEAGLIRAEIDVSGDEPIVVWKSQIAS